MPTRSLALMALLLAPTVQAGPGCSFVLFDKAPWVGEWQTGEPETCMTSRALPFLDLFYAAGFGAIAVGASLSTNREGEPNNTSGMPLGTAVFGALFAVSGAYGFIERERCVSYREHLGDRYPRP